jgi:hypothetical protein
MSFLCGTATSTVKHVTVAKLLLKLVKLTINIVLYVL